MDRSSERLAAFALHAELWRVAGPQTTSNEPNSLLDILLNPEFIPSNLGATQGVRTGDSSLYDDLPPLEDDSSPGGSHSEGLSSSEDEMPPLEDDIQLLLEADDAPPTLEAITVSQSIPNGNSSAVASASSPSSSGPIRSSHATTTPHSASAEAADDNDAESDSSSSLPSLQSVSDSSDEEDFATSSSDSDWDDEEGFSNSDADDEHNVVNQMIEHVEPFSEAMRATLAQTLSTDIEAIQSEVTRVTTMMQTYTDLVARARAVIPNLDDRFQPPPDWVADLTLRATGVDNDPKRAEMLLPEMEVASDDLVRRYELLRTGNEEDVDGCAICRDDLLDKAPQVIETQDLVALYATLPFHPEADCIVVFPCAGKHLFHKDCLSPWLARKTTCPTCRFDIDPLSLTLQLSSGRRDTGAPDLDSEPIREIRVWRPPQVESLSDWLTAEEEAQKTGVSRKRPAVCMPEYPSIISPATPVTTAGTPPPRPARPAGTPLLADLFETPVPDFEANSGTAGFYMAAAYRDLDEMRQRFLTEGASRLHENVLREAHPSVEHRTELPARSPSAPPAAYRTTSPPMLGPAAALPSFTHLFRSDAPLDSSPAFGSMRWSAFEALREQSELRYYPDGIPWRVNTSDVDPLPALIPTADPLAQLHDTPLVLSPPPSSIEVGAMHTHVRQQRYNAGESSPTVATSPTSAPNTVPIPITREGVRNMWALGAANGPLSPISTSHVGLIRNSAEFRERMPHLTAFTAPRTQPSSIHIASSNGVVDATRDSGSQSGAPSSPSNAGDVSPSSDYNTADDLD